ncbi:MAG: hypothetical protein M3Y65_04020 [Pseudomonadota bacterium]|nr:hypothetical protein [Pseudomonadota bacterium]
MNVYLPTCTEEEWCKVLGPLGAMIAETGDGAGLRVFGGAEPALQTRDYVLEQPVIADR